MTRIIMLETNHHNKILYLSFTIFTAIIRSLILPESAFQNMFLPASCFQQERDCDDDLESPRTPSLTGTQKTWIEKSLSGCRYHRQCLITVLESWLGSK